VDVTPDIRNVIAGYSTTLGFVKVFGVRYVISDITVIWIPETRKPQ